MSVELRFNIANQDSVDLPEELLGALFADKAAQQAWDRLTPGKQRGLAYFVGSTPALVLLSHPACTWNVFSIRLKASGFSIITAWPAPETAANLEPAIASCSFPDFSGEIGRSSSPDTARWAPGSTVIDPMWPFGRLMLREHEAGSSQRVLSALSGACDMGRRESFVRTGFSSRVRRCWRCQKNAHS